MVRDDKSTGSDEDESFANLVNDDENDSAVAGELKAWREVHSNLLIAVRVAQDAVSYQKQQRRYWLEEVVTNLNEDGKLAAASHWKRPVSLSSYSTKECKQPAKSGATAAAKRKKRDSSPLEALDKPPKKPRKKKEDRRAAEIFKQEKIAICPNESTTFGEFDVAHAKPSPHTSATNPTWDDSFRSEDGDIDGDLSNSKHSTQASTTKSNDYRSQLPAAPVALKSNSNISGVYEASFDDETEEEVEDDEDPSSLMQATTKRPFYAEAALPPTLPRTYTSIQEIANEDDDSDQDPF